MDWITCTKSFVAVIQQGSLSQAAKHLDISNSALSKRLSWLELQLGVPLLKRTTRHLSLTDAGDVFFQRSLTLLDHWQQLITETTATNKEMSGTLHIGAPLTTGSHFLINVIATFCQRYPNINIALHTLTSGQLPDLNLDIIICSEIDNFNSASYIATPLFSDHARFYASPDYLEQHDPLESPEQLTQHNCLLLNQQHHTQEYVFDNGLTLRLQGNFITSNPEILIASAVENMGLILTSPQNIQRELAHGLLIPVLTQLQLPKQTTFAYYPKLSHQHTKTKHFIDFIKEKNHSS
ncbi:MULTISPECIES: LysR family transcriptional regulator [unclassified Photobacterium]|uniref:LysR family transcriptional regulator n=1 Tax=unclassified Photobacterium TaxID=2628852 RepID=UPI001EDE53ED|nr:MULTISPECIES: LysR family transcriptional regulator [unclassified Photobacterium]MCG3862851.1 LysR family transcriptional regulator [Photobacterium sp. Ph6]MCG3874284.1 LysR family transcriptional regulator [Photobacterium sp. Ph5]